MKRCIISIVLSILLSFSYNIHAQTGTLKGRVIDAETKEPIPFANVVIEMGGAQKGGSATDFDGYYTIKPINPGTYSVKVLYVGYQSKQVNGVVIIADKIRFVDVELTASMTMLEAFEIVDYEVPLISRDQTCSGGTVTCEEIAKMPNRNKSAIATTVGGVYVADGGQMNIRGERNTNTEEYDYITENIFNKVSKSPLSTFSIDVDRASYSNVRRFLNDGQLPQKGAVRIEEMINYFEYDYLKPQEKPFEVYSELGNCPWNEDHVLLQIGLQGKDLHEEEEVDNNLVFLLDVSGSMGCYNKLPLVKKALSMLVRKLDEDDRVAIVVYAGASGLVLPSTSCENKAEIVAALDQLNAGGSTAGGAGIKLAYKTAIDNFITGGNNRVILATDGDFNVGVSSQSALVELIEEKRESGVFLSVLGFGTGNYSDARMEQLADHGNGNYSYIDNIKEAQKVLVNEMNSTLYTIAKDVKLQIEFNPEYVKEYRLIGYENRVLNNEDFDNDQKDAGEIGAGHTVTALYELVLKSKNRFSKDTRLRYQESVLKEKAQSDELVYIKIRYKEPDKKRSKLIDYVVINKLSDQMNNTDNFKFAASVAAFGMLLRDSEFIEKVKYSDVIQWAQNCKGEDKNGYRSEFIQLVKLAKDIDNRYAYKD